jgi:hypothetical protein
MGDTWMPDKVVTLEEVLHCFIVLEEEWEARKGDLGMRLQTALTGAILIAGFFGALRGEEMPRLELGAIRKHWDEATHHSRTPHVPLVLAGRFKMTQGERLFFLPLACKSSSGVEIQVWIARLLEAYDAVGVTTGPIFRVAQKGSRVKRSAMGDLDLLFYDVLGKVQDRWPRVLPPSTKIQDEISVRRSLRRGSTTEASNRRIPREVIEANQRWGKHQRSRGVLPSMGMMERYTDARANVGYLVQYSLGL